MGERDHAMSSNRKREECFTNSSGGAECLSVAYLQTSCTAPLCSIVGLTHQILRQRQQRPLYVRTACVRVRKLLIWDWLPLAYSLTHSLRDPMGAVVAQRSPSGPRLVWPRRTGVMRHLVRSMSANLNVEMDWSAEESFHCWVSQINILFKQQQKIT